MADVKVETTVEAPRNRITADAFVKAYLKVYKAGGSNADLAKETGLVYGSVVQRIKSMTERGTILPPLKRAAGGNKLDVAALNATIAALLAEGSEQPAE